MLSAGFKVVLVGLAFGVIGAAWLAGAIQSLLVGVTPLDPVTYVAAAFVLATVVLAAILVPAVRATRMDPVIALQAE